MILNVSGRTDIIAFYTPWFLNRLKEGFVDVRNPFNKTMISRIYFKDVDAILFCTKNPIPIVNHLKEINFPILFHITITPYNKDIEPFVPSKKEIISAVKEISKIIGIANLAIRYDPIFINDKYTLDYHLKAFAKLTELFDGYINKIIVSFIDDYKNVRNNRQIINNRPFTKEDYKTIGKNFSEIAKKHNMTVQTCFEEETLVEYGFIKDDCISHTLAFKLTGKTNFKRWTARKERKCNCVQMVDIGEYNSCKHLCKYCYANFDETKVLKNYQSHDPSSSLLIGHPTEYDIIKIRTK